MCRLLQIFGHCKEGFCPPCTAMWAAAAPLPCPMAEPSEVLGSKTSVFSGERPAVLHHWLLWQEQAGSPTMALQKDTETKRLRALQKNLFLFSESFDNLIDWAVAFFSRDWSIFAVLLIHPRSVLDYDMCYIAWPSLWSFHLRWSDVCWKQLAVGMCPLALCFEPLLILWLQLLFWTFVETFVPFLRSCNPSWCDRWTKSL